MFVIGLTGGIGTGKTEVTHVLKELGAIVIDSDKAAHLSYERFDVRFISPIAYRIRLVLGFSPSRTSGIARLVLTLIA